jgi:hypothetical protein
VRHLLWLPLALSVAVVVAGGAAHETIPVPSGLVLAACGLLAVAVVWLLLTCAKWGWRGGPLVELGALLLLGALLAGLRLGPDHPAGPLLAGAGGLLMLLGLLSQPSRHTEASPRD